MINYGNKILFSLCMEKILINLGIHVLFKSQNNYQIPEFTAEDFYNLEKLKL